MGAAVVIAVLGYIGFEGAAVLAEEARRQRRTVATATYVSLALIALLYGGSSWALAAHYGSAGVVGASQALGPGALFSLGGRALSEAAQVLYLTSLLAAMLAFHTIVSRYGYGLARDRVLPAALARTAANGSPRAASLAQSAVGLAVIMVYAAAGWDPMITLFFWLGTTGGLGVLFLLVATSVAAVVFFARAGTAEPWWRRAGAPALSAAVLGTFAVLVVRNYHTLLGVPAGSAAAVLFPLAYLGFALLGAAVGRWRR